MAGLYIRRGEKIVGPVEIPKLQELVAAGRLLPTDQLAKDVAGPWKEAGSTTLFSKSKQTPITESEPPPPPMPLVPKAVRVPAAVETPEDGGAAQQVLQVVHVVFGGIGRGILATWGAVSRSLATRSQRKHELKIANIQAKALVDSQRPSAPQPNSAPPVAAATPQPAVFAPQIHQTTVVHVVNKNKQSVYGCSGCSVVLLLILIGLIVLAIMSSTSPR